MTSLFPPFNRRSSFRKQPYFYEAGRGVNYKSTGGPFPTLDLNFLSGTLDPRITFSRASNATLTDSTGKITYAPNNLLLQSQTFDSATWSKGGATVTANSSVAPDGTTTADQIVEDTSNGLHRIFQGVTLSAANYTFSIYAKPNGRNWIYLYADGGLKTAFVNVATGAIGTLVGSPTVTATAVGNGWYRVAMSYVGTITTGQSMIVNVASADTTTSYQGDGTSGLFVWGAQLEAVTYQTTPSTYNATTTAAYYGPRFDYDPVTLAAKGLLIEEARTNLQTYSEQFDNAIWTKDNGSVSTNSVAAPDGTTSADTFTPNTSLGQHRLVATSVTVTNATAYTQSVYVRPNGYTKVAFRDAVGSGAYVAFDLTGSGTVLTTSGGSGTIQPITVGGNTWYRITMTSTSSGTSYRGDIWVLDPTYTTGVVTNNWTPNGTSGVYMWGAQLEAGAFATSYIPTVASSVARSADIARMTGTNFSSWFNPNEGTFSVQSDIIAINTAKSATLLGVQISNYLPLYLVASATPFGRTWDGTNIATTANFVSAGSSFKIANAYRADGLSICLNGGAVASNNYSGAFSSTTSMFFGSGNNGTDLFLNGHIASIKYYPTRLPNTQLVSLTQPSLTPSMQLVFDTSSTSFTDANWSP